MSHKNVSQRAMLQECLLAILPVMAVAASVSGQITLQSTNFQSSAWAQIDDGGMRVDGVLGLDSITEAVDQSDTVDGRATATARSWAKFDAVPLRVRVDAGAEFIYSRAPAYNPGCSGFGAGTVEAVLRLPPREVVADITILRSPLQLIEKVTCIVIKDDESDGTLFSWCERGLRSVRLSGTAVPRVRIIATGLLDASSRTIMSSFHDLVSSSITIAELDCNENGVADAEDIASGASTDCDLNSIPDECDLRSWNVDCDHNGLLDSCEVATNSGLDCDSNEVLDVCDISSGTLTDCDGEGIPDVCEIAAGSVHDCDQNGLPDSCDVTVGAGADCNGNGIPDTCDVTEGREPDANQDGFPDSCALSRLYVDAAAKGLNNGTTWRNAYTTLAAALNHANASHGIVQEVRLAQGTYQPAQRSDPNDRRSATFSIRQPMNILGGFAGSSYPAPDAHDPTLYPVILSGDLDADDASNPAAWQENAYHVISTLNVEGDVYLEDMTISGGNADYDGGGILAYEANLVITRCSFQDNWAGYRDSNSANTAALHVPGGGGAIYANASAGVWPPRYIVIRDSQFSRNGTTTSGGALSTLGVDVFVQDSVFEDNEGRYGGAVGLWEALVARFEGCTYQSNQGEYGGGMGIYGRRYQPIAPIIVGCSFSANGPDGAIYGEWSSAVIEDCTFSQNVSSRDIVFLPSVVAKDSHFVQNEAHRSVLYAHDATIANCTFDENSVEGSVLEGTTLSVRNCDFNRNQAEWGEGTIHADVLEIVGTTMTANKAATGAGVYVREQLNCIDCSFGLNRSAWSGGAITFQGKSMVVERSSFIDNSAGDLFATATVAPSNTASESLPLGGAIHFLFGQGTITDCIFHDNNAGFGGALSMIEGGSVRVAHSTFSSNRAEEGGAAYVHSNFGAQLEVSDCLFQSNMARIRGGAISAEYLRATGARFQANSSGTGGAVFASGDVKFLGTILDSNTATVGGALYVSSGKAGAANSVFFANQAQFGGGVAHAAHGLNMNFCTVVKNSAFGLGGGLLTSPSDVAVANSIFWGNEVYFRGEFIATESAQIDGIEFVDLKYSTIEDLISGAVADGNDRSNPSFAGLEKADTTGLPDLHLDPASPAINSGASDYVSGFGEADLDGKPRVLCGRVDRGAYEFGVVGDMDCDRALTLADFAEWTSCETGPSDPQPLGDCQALDAHVDGLIDLHDFAKLQEEFNAPVE